jgi:hypothetical protein
MGYKSLLLLENLKKGRDKGKMINKVNLKIRLLTVSVMVVFLGIVLAVPASAQIPLPHAFFGNIQINGEPAPIGTIVEVRGEGIEVGLEGNPIIITEDGKYGSEGPFGVKLIAQGDIEGNPVLTFYVNGQSTGQTTTWQSGGITSFDLSLTVSGDAEPPEQQTGQPSVFTSVLFGEDHSVSISDTGKILEAIEVTASLPNGKVTISIEADTLAVSKYGSPITSLTAEVDPTPPPVPEDYNSIYMPCNFGPDGATFNPPIVLTFHYDPADFPENTNEEDLVIAFYDNSAGEWVPLLCEVDAVNNTVTASVSDFTSFAILVPKVEISPTPTSPTEPEEESTPTTVSPAPTSPTEPEEESTPTTVSPAPTSPTEPVEEEQPDEAGAGTNWFVLGGVIAAGVVIIAVIIIRRIMVRG